MAPSDNDSTVAFTSKEVPSISVVIATYRRPADLQRCLDALQQQGRVPAEVVIVARASDEETWAFLLGYESASLLLRTITIGEVGLVCARKAAVSSCTTDVIAFLDDDTAPHHDWVERVGEAFRVDPSLGGLCGRDWRYDGSFLHVACESKVGIVGWFGRITGNHHLGVGAAREVDYLKGASMSFRRSALQGIDLEGRLRGRGIEAFEDGLMGVHVKKAGWKTVYDPGIGVDHFEAIRWVGQRQNDFTDMREHFDRGHNEMVFMGAFLPPLRRAAYVLWSVLCGTRASPGLVQAVRFTPQYRLTAWRRFAHFQGGKLLAIRDRIRAAASR
jgi:cellulose synthase/poly-beta-1,6-N-acetylglucosamine synthase-like glycosyltransferase